MRLDKPLFECQIVQKFTEIEWLFIQILLKNVPFKSGQHRVPEIYEYRDNVDDVIVVLPTWDDVWGEFAFDLEDENSPRWT
jgi:hypothetical protein